MRTSLFVMLVVAALVGCSPQPPAKKHLPDGVATMNSDQLKTLYAECTKYGSPYDTRIVYSEGDCAYLSGRIESESWKAAAKYKGVGVGQPILH